MLERRGGAGEQRVGAAVGNADLENSTWNALLDEAQERVDLLAYLVGAARDDGGDGVEALVV
ncbi:MAG TPA: hypothetical protein VFB78_17975 [Acidimicrobiales bacterium]|nr:hypothetical protein [Acidimicrobiales bacterium]